MQKSGLFSSMCEDLCSKIGWVGLNSRARSESTVGAQDLKGATHGWTTGEIGGILSVPSCLSQLSSYQTGLSAQSQLSPSY